MNPFARLGLCCLYAAISLCFIFIGNIIFSWIPPLQNGVSSTLASWAQAIAAICAIYVAIRSNTSDTRRRNASDLVTAKLTAANVYLQLAATVSEVEKFKCTTQVQIDLSVDHNQYPLDLNYSRSAALTLKKINSLLPGLDKIYALAPLPNSCAFNLSVAIDRLKALELRFEQINSQFSSLAGKPEGQNPLRDQLDSIGKLLNDASILLKKASQECQLDSMSDIDVL